MAGLLKAVSIYDAGPITGADAKSLAAQFTANIRYVPGVLTQKKLLIFV